MKKSSIPGSSPANSAKTNSTRDIRNNLDSRKNTEQDFKGNDITHNKKEEKSAKPKSHH